MSARPSRLCHSLIYSFAATLLPHPYRELGMSDKQKEADGCAARFFNCPSAEVLVTVVRVLPFAIEKVVGRVRHKRLIADIV
jgi:hypothetical protein